MSVVSAVSAVSAMSPGHAAASPVPHWLIPAVVVGVIVLGIVITVVKMAFSKKQGGSVDAWAHGAYSLWTGGEDSATWTPKRAQDSFASWYDARSGGTSHLVIDGLRKGQTGNPAWDKVRALDLVRMALAAGYYDKDQVRQREAGIGRELQQTYGSWEDLARAFEGGMQEWQRGRGVTDPNELGRVQKNLPKLRSEIWPKVKYATTLTDE
jgi:hypothetical protein